MINRIHLLQEDLRWQEEFIGEIAKYDRELANNVLVAISEGDENMNILLQQSGLLEEGIGARYERGDEVGGKVYKDAGFGRLGKFFGVEAGAKVGAGMANAIFGKDK